jgi:hypothetical protein
MASKNGKQPRGITGITISGFKSLREESHIEVRPLTILAGANSSGKSSIMQPLLLMKQTLESSHDPGTFLLDGGNVAFSSVDQFMSRKGRDQFSDFTVTLYLSNDKSISVRYQKLIDKNGNPIVPIEMHTRDSEGDECTFKQNMSPHEIRSQIDDKLVEFFESVDEKTADKSIVASWRVIRDRCFLLFQRFYSDEREYAGTIKVGHIDGYEDLILDAIHVPGLRGNPKRNYPAATATGPRFPSTFEYYVAGIIYYWGQSENNRLNTLSNYLKLLGLTWKVEAKRLDDTQVEIRVGRTKQPKRGGSQDMVSIADVGFGVSQVLPVLVALLAAEPGQLVYIEQPELHLHPRAQVALAQILADAANRGVRVVAETHSSLLLLSLQTLIANGSLKPEDTILHWFQRDEDSGNTHITPVIPDLDGAYGDWPEDFTDVELETQKHYLDTVAEKAFGVLNGS